MSQICCIMSCHVHKFLFCQYFLLRNSRQISPRPDPFGKSKQKYAGHLRFKDLSSSKGFNTAWLPMKTCMLVSEQYLICWNFLVWALKAQLRIFRSFLTDLCHKDYPKNISKAYQDKLHPFCQVITKTVKHIFCDKAATHLWF